MDYLTRDSFYTGVVEGVIGYKRLISMMNVVEDQLVLEEKAMISIEKFLMARHFMYRQVYLHKTAIVAERMLREFVIRLKELIKEGQVILNDSLKLGHFLKDCINGTINGANYLERYQLLDDIDVFSSLKHFQNHPDSILNYLSTCLLNRDLFTAVFQESPIPSDLSASVRHKLVHNAAFKPNNIDKLVFEGSETIAAYDLLHNDVKILKKNGDLSSLSDEIESLVKVQKNTRHYICYPKIID